MTSPHLIGISGKIGSGKNYLAEKLSEVLYSKDYSMTEISFAIPLKDQASEIIYEFRKLNPEAPSFDRISQRQGISITDLAVLYGFISPELKINPDINGWTRAEGVRRTLQYLGTDIRRAQYENYWVDKLSDYIPNNVDFVFVTDARFPNEAQSVLDRNGTLIRIEVPEEVILQRTSTRDGLKYSKEALAHDSEKALDNFTNFDLTIGETFNAEEIVNWILTRSNKEENA